MWSRFSVCLAAGLTLATAVVADERAPDPQSRAIDVETVARAFRSLPAGSRGAVSACAAALSAVADRTDSPFRAALLGHIFSCDWSTWAFDAAGDRLATTFAVVAATPGAGYGSDQVPFARSFHRYGLPEAIVAAEVVEPARFAVLATGEEAGLGPEGAPVEIAALPPSRATVVAPADTVAVEAEAPQAPAVDGATEDKPVVEPATTVAAADPQEARPLFYASPEVVVAAEEEAEPQALRAERRTEAASRRSVRRAEIAVAAARRRATRTVSVSRTVRISRTRGLAGRPPRAIRLRETDAALEPAAVSRPQTRSFSPKMSSAGPAQPAPSQ